MRYPWMNIRCVSRELRHLLAQEGGKILVHDDGLEGGYDPPPGGLENVLVRPIRVHLTHSLSLQM